LKITNIQKREIIDGKTTTSPIKPEDCIDVVAQKLNPDYPKTTLKGGTGKGILITGIVPGRERSSGSPPLPVHPILSRSLF